MMIKETKKRVPKDTGNYDLLLTYGYIRKMCFFYVVLNRLI